MSNDQRKISYPMVLSQYSGTSVFSTDTGLTRTFLLASSFRGVAGGSHSNVSFEDVHLDLPDTLTPLFQKLDVRTHTHTHTHTHTQLICYLMTSQVII